MKSGSIRIFLLSLLLYFIIFASSSPLASLFLLIFTNLISSVRQRNISKCYWSLSCCFATSPFIYLRIKHQMEGDTAHSETLTDSFTRAQAYHHLIIIAQAETFNSIHCFWAANRIRQKWYAKSHLSAFAFVRT